MSDVFPILTSFQSHMLVPKYYPKDYQCQFLSVIMNLKFLTSFI